MGKSLLEILREVAVDPAEQAVLEHTGAATYLARHGFHDVDLEDLREAVDLAADTLPPDVAQTLAFTGDGLVEGYGEPGEPDVAAFGDVTEMLDGPSPDGGRQTDVVESSDEAVDAAHPAADVVAGEETSLTFGVGAGAGSPAEDDVFKPRVDAVDFGAEHGALDVGVAATDGSLDQVPDTDANAGIEPADVLTGDISETDSYEMPEDSGALDDIGSF